MKYIVIFLFFTFNLNAQFVYNNDSTFTLGVKELNDIRIKIEENKLMRQRLAFEVDLLEDIRLAQKTKIEKLELRDSLSREEIYLYQSLEATLNEKIDRSNSIMNNYKMILMSKDEELAIKEKERKKENFWKNIYKWGYPILAGALVTTLFAN